MNFFATIIARINRGKMLKLNAPGDNTKMHGDTEEVITIDTIEGILRNEDTFKRFLDWGQNQDFFSGNLNFSDYVQAVKDYVNYFKDRGVVFDKDELKRASIITGEKYKNNKPKTDLSEEEQIANTIYKTGEINEVVADDVKNIEANLKSKIYDLQAIFAQYRVSLNDSIIDKISKMQQQDYENSIEQSSYYEEEAFDSSKYTMDLNLKKLLISKIPKDVTDKGSLAYLIYKVVYSTLQYESRILYKKKRSNRKKIY